jgi:hypothetical protein
MKLPGYRAQDRSASKDLFGQTGKGRVLLVKDDVPVALHVVILPETTHQRLHQLGWEGPNGWLRLPVEFPQDGLHCLGGLCQVVVRYLPLETSASSLERKMGKSRSSHKRNHSSQLGDVEKPADSRRFY